MAESKIIAYNVVSLLGILFSVFVAASITKAGLRTISSKLLVYFHATLMLDILSFFPYVYSRFSSTLCAFMAWLHYYSGLANAVVTFLMILYYRNLLLTDTWARFAFKVKWRMEMLIVGIPLITLLPLITNAYHEVNNEWCDLEVDTTEGILWTVFAYYVWIIILVIVGSIMFVRTVLRVYELDIELALNIISTIGMYCILSIVSLVLRVVMRELFGSYASIGYGISAFGYFLIFLRERKSLILFEMFKQQQADDGSSVISSTYESDVSLNSSFSWDLDETRSSFSYGKEGGGLLSIGGVTGCGATMKGKTPAIKLQRLSVDASEGGRRISTGVHTTQQSHDGDSDSETQAKKATPHSSTTNYSNPLHEDL